MARLTEEFDQSQVTYDPNFSGNFEPLPAGRYRVQIIESKERETSTGSGMMLELTFQVVEGPFENRRVWDRLNYRNQSPDAQRIARESLKKICEDVGHSGILRDSEELHFKPFMVYVTLEPGQGQYGPQNRLRYFGKAGAAQAGGGGNSMNRPHAAPASGSMQGQGARAGGAGNAQGRGAHPWQQGGAGAGASATQAAGAKSQQQMDDEIPF